MNGFGYTNAGKGFILKYIETSINRVIIASTQLHLFNAIILSHQFPKNHYHLFYIDKSSVNDSYFISLKKWENNLFKSQSIWITNKQSLWSKIDSKRRTVKEMYAKILELNPTEVIVGNDRKNEVSALLYQLSKDIKISYMDDGIHSYIIEKSNFLQYTFLDNLFKSVIYRMLITTPKLIGCQNKISCAYLYKPALSHEKLKQKKMIELKSHFLQSSSFKKYISFVIDSLDITIQEELKGIKHILLLPHPKSIDTTHVNALLSIITSDMAIKLHPRDTKNLKIFQSKGIKVLDSRLVAELIFLHVEPNIKLYGFNSTALLMGKWLRQNLDIFSLKFNNDPSTIVEKLMQQNGVKIIPVKEINLLLIT